MAYLYEACDSIVAEKNVTKNILGQMEGGQR